MSALLHFEICSKWGLLDTDVHDQGEDRLQGLGYLLQNDPYRELTWHDTLRNQSLMQCKIFVQSIQGINAGPLNDLASRFKKKKA